MAIDDDSVTPGELPAIEEAAAWQEHLPAVITGVKVQGGATGLGAANFQARVLDARTRFLKAAIAAIEAGDLNGVKLVGYLDTEEELAAIDTTNLAVGTAYFLNFEMRMWDGTEWTHSGSLRGERGINLLGSWPTLVPLPEITENVIGDAYLWKSDIWILVPDVPAQGAEPGPNSWEALGIRGPDGKSTYELYKELPGNENKTLQQFITEQKGLQGDDAYEAWLKIPANDGKTREQWAEETRGLKGDTGPARAPFAVSGTKANTGLLPTPGDETEAWYVGIDLYVWVEANQNYTMIPGVAGKSAYQIWVESDQDHEGQSEAQFLLALKGAKGDNSTVPGPPGTDGRNLRIIGTVAKASDLNAIGSPVDQDAYATLDTGRLWMFLPTEGGWKDLGPWRGVDGKSAFEVWIADGHPGETLSQFWAFLKGTDGTSLVIRGVVATFSALPASPEEQWLYGVKDESALYLYLDGAWVEMGKFGKDGTNGTNGVDGKSLDVIKILTEADQVPPVANTGNKGKAYVTWNPRDVYVNVSGSAWENAGPFMPPGELGPTGANWRPKGMIANVNGLPSTGSSEEGDAWVTVDTKLIYTLVDGQWSAPIDLIGPEGKQGEQGIPGALMPIKGTYQSMALLRAAHPTGVLGDAYMIIDAAALPTPIRNLAVWSAETNDWVDTGPAGVKGDKGNPGNDSIVPGPRGDKGSQWLTLDTQDAPSGSFNGRVGDWAVNQLLRVYYKTVNQGWVYWGQLVAGDVNSPLLAEGKVVRLGNAWTPLPVDEVPGMVADKLYVRSLINGSVDNKGEWVELEFPAGIEEPPADGTPYLRLRVNGQLVGSWATYSAPTLASLGGVALSELGVSVATLVAGKIPAGQLPSYVDDVLEFANQAAFPATGESGKIYIAANTNVQYRWTGTVYIALVASPGTSDAVVEGSVNLYYTPARVRSTPLAGVSFATGGTIAATDTVLTAFGKLQAQITAFVPGFTDVPTDSNLYLRKGDHTWSVYTAPTLAGLGGVAAPANDGKTYVYKGTAWAEFNRYDLAILSISATATVDALVTGFVKVDNTGATAKTITLSDGPKAPARAMTLVIKINGAAGVITFAPTGATALVWNGGTPPPMTGSRTIVTFLWDGVEWTGSPGAVVP